jgi:hypothetical protein
VHYSNCFQKNPVVDKMSVDLISGASWAWAGKLLGGLVDSTDPVADEKSTQHPAPSWLSTDDSGDDGDDDSISTYTTESSGGFDANFLVLTERGTFDEMSTLVDSAGSDDGSRSTGCSTLSEDNITATTGPPLRSHTGTCTGPPRRSSSGRLSTSCSIRSSLPPYLDPISEEEEEEEDDEHEAYLRAKMTSLWTRIQESAQFEDLSAAPCTSQDEELLKAYAVKRYSLALLRRS